MSAQERALRRRCFRKITAVFMMFTALALGPLVALELLVAIGAS